MTGVQERVARLSTEFVGTTGELRCPICGNAHWRTVIDRRAQRLLRDTTLTYACTSRTHGSGVQIVECLACSMRVLGQPPSAAAVEAAYVDVQDPAYLTIEPQRRIAYRVLAERIERRCPPPGRLLDVGCYTGLFPEVAAACGWEAFGLEPSRWAASLAEQRIPGRVTNGFLRDAPLAPQNFDVITSWDVIEHVTDPTGDLERMAALLKPQGWLFLSTMRSDAPVVKLLGARWPWYMEMHRFYFTPRTLRTLLEKTGFTLRSVESYPHYTNVRYLCWKLEGLMPPVGKLAHAVSNALNISERTLKIDLGDFFLAAAQRR